MSDKNERAQFSALYHTKSGGARPRVQGAERQPKFTIWDKVTVYMHHSRSRTGPYYVYEYRSGFKYILSNIQDGTLISGGAEFDEDDLNLIEG